VTQSRYNQGGGDHPFAPYVRTLGRGRTGTRSLTREEARTAFTMILEGRAQDLQLGAFLMLLRVKEESPEELAGFIDACRAHLAPASRAAVADLDWSSYAGKKHQHPWFLLSILLLAAAGYRVFIHGCDNHTPGRLYTEVALRELGLPVAQDWEQAASQLDTFHLSYLPLRCFAPPLHDLLQLKPVFVEVDPVSFNLSPEAIEEAITPRTKAIMPVPAPPCRASSTRPTPACTRKRTSCCGNRAPWCSRGKAARWR